MLAIISFGLLGIWTTILGFINNYDNFPTREPKTDQEISTVYPAHEPKAEADILPGEFSEISGAFENLWKEIIHGI